MAKGRSQEKHSYREFLSRIRPGHKKNYLPVKVFKRREVIIAKVKKIAKRRKVQISGIKVLGREDRAVSFKLVIIKENVRIYLYLEKRGVKEIPNFEHSRLARFYISFSRRLKNVEEEIDKYFVGLIKGFKLENLTKVALNELKEEGIILDWQKSSPKEDMQKGEDFFIKIDEKTSCPFQVKSSWLYMVEWRKKYFGVSAFYYQITGNEKKDVRGIKRKVKRIIVNAKKKRSGFYLRNKKV